jgi:hypothetical protein
MTLPALYLVHVKHKIAHSSFRLVDAIAILGVTPAVTQYTCLSAFACLLLHSPEQLQYTYPCSPSIDFAVLPAQMLRTLKNFHLASVSSNS